MLVLTLLPKIRLSEGIATVPADSHSLHYLTNLSELKKLSPAAVCSQFNDLSFYSLGSILVPRSSVLFPSSFSPRHLFDDLVV